VKRGGEDFKIRIKDMDMERRNRQQKTQWGGDKENMAIITMGGSRKIKLHEMARERIDDDSSQE
jgi:hypothetical protein